MIYLPEDFLIIVPNQRGADLLAFQSMVDVQAFLEKNSQAVLVRYNVHGVGNNNPSNSWAEAQSSLRQIRKSDPNAIITMMTPHRPLDSPAHLAYYDCLDLFE